MSNGDVPTEGLEDLSGFSLGNMKDTIQKDREVVCANVQELGLSMRDLDSVLGNSLWLARTIITPLFVKQFNQLQSILTSKHEWIEKHEALLFEFRSDLKFCAAQRSTDHFNPVHRSRSNWVSTQL